MNPDDYDWSEDRDEPYRSMQMLAWVLILMLLVFVGGVALLLLW